MVIVPVPLPGVRVGLDGSVSPAKSAVQVSPTTRSSRPPPTALAADSMTASTPSESHIFEACGGVQEERDDLSLWESLEFNVNARSAMACGPRARGTHKARVSAVFKYNHISTSPAEHTECRNQRGKLPTYHFQCSGDANSSDEAGLAGQACAGTLEVLCSTE